jgi:hypothetical protein
MDLDRLADALEMKKPEVKKALDRHRKRVRKPPAGDACQEK